MSKKRERKERLHPEYRMVAFVDTCTGVQYLCGTTWKGKNDKTCMIDGVEYPLCEVSISSSSHPLFTGQKYVDTEGRISKFNKRYRKSSS
ncbi:type B 50S ribosomal protein L31 [Candidatus Similichlamydia epinepheli]|uniref:type B 50S ribosomal protein L31 n=1 Tax=Candidatus Similichlamydia epinepheli TaxID=1903953 RepID=UPI000D39FA19|nr:type B 50S ribosomal protein L31 [Candidatus Similichlamydia epinepheli]